MFVYKGEIQKVFITNEEIITFFSQVLRSEYPFFGYFLMWT